MCHIHYSKKYLRSVTLRAKFQVSNFVIWYSTIMSMKCSVSGTKWYKAHVTVSENFTITNILNVVTQLQLEFCKRIQHLFKYPTNKNHHNFLQNHTKSISTWSLSNHKSSKIFLNIRSIVVATEGMQIGLVIPRTTAWLHAPHLILVLRNVKNTSIWNKQKLVLTTNKFWKIELKLIQRVFFVFNV